MRKSLAACGALLAAATLALSAGPASASTVSQATRPARTMTGAQRAALPRVSFSRIASPTPARPSAQIVPAANAVNSEFDFCNSNIACFLSTLHFVSHTQFQLQSTQLVDSLCDNRSVYADVYDQNGYLAEFSNSLGCHRVADFPTETISDSGGVRYVQIDLYACNFWGCSSDAWSLPHWSPY
jgi:hypothetical protein